MLARGIKKEVHFAAADQVAVNRVPWISAKQSHYGGKHRRRENIKTAAESDEAAGVRALLQRDRKELQLPEDPFTSSNPVGQPPSPSPPASAGQQAAKARTEVLKETAGKGETGAVAGPRTASSAIKAGVEALQAGRAAEAIDLFQKALELPGAGAFRMADSPREYSCASEGEEIAALYNMACAYCSLDKSDSALACLEGAIQTGFRDYDTLRRDPDLKLLQGPALERLINESSKGEGFFSKLFGGKR